jgi:hypothetical protein
MASIVAERLIARLGRDRFVIMRRPGLGGHSAIGRGFEGWHARFAEAARHVHIARVVTIFVTAEPYAAIAGEKPDPAAYDGRGGGFPLVLASETLTRLKAARGLLESYSEVILRLAKGESATLCESLVGGFKSATVVERDHVVFSAIRNETKFGCVGD